MDALEAVLSRIEVRDFAPTPVPRDVQIKVLEAARMAPSAYNKQLWHFILIDDRKLLTDLGKISTTGPYIKDAAFAVAVLVDKTYPQSSMDSDKMHPGHDDRRMGVRSGVMLCWGHRQRESQGDIEGASEALRRLHHPVRIPGEGSRREEEQKTSVGGSVPQHLR